MTVEINLKDVLKGYEKAQREIPFATSRAMQIVTQKAAEAARRSAVRDLDRPTKTITRERNGAIRSRYPSKQDVKRGFQRADGSTMEAAVYIAGKGLRNSSKLDLIDELHPVVFGGTSNRVPASSRQVGVITPTRALIKGLSGKGRLKKLNQYGNIAGFKNGVLKKLRDNSRLYLNVPLNNTDRKTQQLKPGLYFKGRELVNGEVRRSGTPSRLVHSTARARRRGSKSKKRINNYLVMLLAYDKIRQTKQTWDYPKSVNVVYRKEYGAEFFFQYQRAVRQALSK